MSKNDVLFSFKAAPRIFWAVAEDKDVHNLSQIAIFIKKGLVALALPQKPSIELSFIVENTKAKYL